MRSGDSDHFAQVTSALDELRPAMQADGGDVRAISIENGVVTLEFQGACLECPSIDLTLKHGIEPALRSRFAWIECVRRTTTEE